MRTAITYDDVLLVPRYSEVTPDMVDIKSRLTKNIELDVPIISAPMDTVTEHQMASAMSDIGGIGIIHKNMPFGGILSKVGMVKSRQNRIVGVALSPTKYTREDVITLEGAGVDVFVLDSAHGHSKNVIKALEDIKSFTKADVIVGNIATAEAARRLKNAGADALKVGIGPGSICTTRIVAGVGVPQITAIQDVAGAGTDLPIIADGGIRYSGDIPKAIAAGADTVMLGSLLAGHDECPNSDSKMFIDGKTYIGYRGMGSEGAMNDGSGDRYSQEGSSKFVPEGIEGCVPYRGMVEDTIYQMVGGLKSAMGYVGARNISELQGRGLSYYHMDGFVRVSPNALAENHPHDIHNIKEAPNYA
jgi:IMP dehydrogenase